MKALFCVTAVLGGVAAGYAADRSTVSPYYVSPRSGAQHVDLSGDWQLAWRDQPINDVSDLKTGVDWMSARVPSSVQMALHRAGKFPHPYYHLNSNQYSWVDEKVWYYRRQFRVPGPISDKYLSLSFDGVDYFTRVWLNKQLLGSHEGMFGGPRLDVSREVVTNGPNELVVEVKAGNWGNKKQFNPRAPGNIILPWALSGGTGTEMFFPLGIWQPVRLDIVPKVHLERPFLRTESIQANEAVIDFSVEALAGVNFPGNSLHPTSSQRFTSFRNSWTSKEVTENYAMVVTLREANGSGRIALDKSYPLRLLEGRNWIRQKLVVESPKLWWPSGLGDQNLYRAEISLRAGRETLDQIQFQYGIRTIGMEPTAGPQTQDLWRNWQFTVNGRPFFAKGVNWMPADLLLDLPKSRYEWLLGMAKDQGLQIIRIWGAGLIETEEFYDACDRLGLLVWQDFPLSNMVTPAWPQDVWEAQVVSNIFRLRNRASLALYCGGNEANPYMVENTASIGIFERSVRLFDNSRPYLRTDPDEGSVHEYPDMDPTWYGKLYKHVPYMSETGMHNIPNAATMREIIDEREFVKPLNDMFKESFAQDRPDFRHHFVEYQPNRVPRMLSRASQVVDISNPSIEDLAEGSQIGAGEFYQVLSDKLQAQYPVTAGLMPWVFKRPWPVVAIQMVDGFGTPTAPYYFLKRSYEATHIMVDFPELMWAPNERIPLQVKVIRQDPAALDAVTANVSVLDDHYRVRYQKSAAMSVKSGPSVSIADAGAFVIPAEFRNRYFFVLAELRGVRGELISRSVYWPRCLGQMEDPAFRDKYRASPQPALTFDRGPWLKPSSAQEKTTLVMHLIRLDSTDNNSWIARFTVRNKGVVPAFATRSYVVGARVSYYASDDYYWLAPGEERQLTMKIRLRDSETTLSAASLKIESWNAAPVQALLR